MRGAILTALVAVALLLAACSAATPADGPGSLRDGAGRAVHPIYGTPLPGTPSGNGGV